MGTIAPPYLPVRACGLEDQPAAGSRVRVRTYPK